jgi:hypothetical protein
MKPKYDVNEIASFLGDDPDKVIDPNSIKQEEITARTVRLKKDQSIIESIANEQSPIKP